MLITKTVETRNADYTSLKTGNDVAKTEAFNTKKDEWVGQVLFTEYEEQMINALDFHVSHDGIQGIVVSTDADVTDDNEVYSGSIHRWRGSIASYFTVLNANGIDIVKPEKPAGAGRTTVAEAKTLGAVAGEFATNQRIARKLASTGDTVKQIADFLELTQTNVKAMLEIVVPS